MLHALRVLLEHIMDRDTDTELSFLTAGPSHPTQACSKKHLFIDLVWLISNKIHWKLHKLHKEMYRLIAMNGIIHWEMVMRLQQSAALHRTYQSLGSPAEPMPHPQHPCPMIHSVHSCWIMETYWDIETVDYHGFSMLFYALQLVCRGCRGCSTFKIL